MDVDLVYAFLTLVLALCIGRWIGQSTRDEHREGWKYFTLLRRCSLIVVGIVLVTTAFSSVGVASLLAAALGYGLSCISLFRSRTLVFIGLAVAVSFFLHTLMLVTSLFVLYFFAYATQRLQEAPRSFFVMTFSLLGIGTVLGFVAGAGLAPVLGALVGGLLLGCE